MKTSRMNAARCGEHKYLGPLCPKHRTHGHERYTSSGQCVRCTRDRSLARQALIKHLLATNGASS